MIEIDLQFCDDLPLISLQLLSMFIDISRIVSMTMFNNYFHRCNQDTWMDISLFIKQAHNLSSLFIHSSLHRYDSSQTIENIHLLVPRHIKCLQIPIQNLNQIKTIVERCENLSTINFDVKDLKLCKEAIQWFADNTINTTCRQGYKTISVWLGKKNIQATQDNYNSKQIKLIENCSNS